MTRTLNNLCRQPWTLSVKSRYVVYTFTLGRNSGPYEFAMNGETRTVDFIAGGRLLMCGGTLLLHSGAFRIGIRPRHEDGHADKMSGEGEGATPSVGRDMRSHREMRDHRTAGPRNEHGKESERHVIHTRRNTV